MPHMTPASITLDHIDGITIDPANLGALCLTQRP